MPAELDTEDPFLSWAEIKLSLRQGLTILLSGGAWLALLRITVWILPVSEIFAGLIWSWVFMGGLFLALWPKDGRPYEEYLSDRIVFLISPKTFIQRDPKVNKRGSVEDADWDEVDDYEPPSL